jgi:RNA polymerase sigma-70 factor (ECF subfamily)
MENAGQEAVTVLLNRMAQGDPAAADALMPQLYAQLHDLAEGMMKRQGSEHTLQPTALVHEAWLRLQGSGVNRAYDNRAHFLGVAAKAMRSVLVDHARRRAALRRGGERERLPLEDVVELFEQSAPDLLGLDVALEKLARVDEQLARIVELRFFGGLVGGGDRARSLGSSTEPTVVRGLARGAHVAARASWRILPTEALPEGGRGGLGIGRGEDHGSGYHAIRAARRSEFPFPRVCVSGRDPLGNPGRASWACPLPACQLPVGSGDRRSPWLRPWRPGSAACPDA